MLHKSVSVLIKLSLNSPKPTQGLIALTVCKAVVTPLAVVSSSSSSDEFDDHLLVSAATVAGG
jgi:hypothetical protein